MEDKDLEAGKEVQKTALQSLPFTYMKTEDPTKADFSFSRRLMIRVGNQPFPPPLTDEQIFEQVKNEKERTQWFLSKEWRWRGQPQEQIEFSIADQKITIYNFNKEKQFDDEHIEKTLHVLKLFAEHFPQALDKLKWILIYDKQGLSIYGDEESYPLNGSSSQSWHAINLEPRVLELFPHRISRTTNLEGTLVHELSHLIADELRDEWISKFQWKGIAGDVENWEYRVNPDGRSKGYYNKKTNERAPIGSFPLQPEQCVTQYAKIYWNEDICESIVAYFFDPELLKRISPDKFEIIKRHDAKKPVPKIEVKRIPTEQIKLPEIKPETVYYFVEEPEAKEEKA